jgi:integrase
MIARKSNAVQTRTAFFYQSAWYVFVNRQRTKLFDGTAEERELWKTGKRMGDECFPLREEVSQALLEMETLQAAKTGTTKEISLRVLGELFLQNREGNMTPASFKVYTIYIADFCSTKNYGNRNAADIVPADVQEWVKKRKTLKSVNTIGSVYKNLKSMFNWGKENHYLKSNPIDDLKVPSSQKRFRHVSDVQYREIMGGLRHRATREFITALFNTGRRPIEVAKLRRSHVVENAGGEPTGVETTEHKNYSKTGKPEFFPFNASMRTLVAEILARPGKPSDALFARWRGGHWTQSGWVSAFHCIRARTGHTVTAYWFRHEFITRSLTAGVPVATVAAMCGNSLAVIQAHYDQSAHLGKAHFADAIERATASIPTAV